MRARGRGGHQRVTKSAAHLVFRRRFRHVVASAPAPAARLARVLGCASGAFPDGRSRQTNSVAKKKTRMSACHSREHRRHDSRGRVRRARFGRYGAARGRSGPVHGAARCVPAPRGDDRERTGFRDARSRALDLVHRAGVRRRRERVVHDLAPRGTRAQQSHEDVRSRTRRPELRVDRHRGHVQLGRPAAPVRGRRVVRETSDRRRRARVVSRGHARSPRPGGEPRDPGPRRRGHRHGSAARGTPGASGRARGSPGKKASRVLPPRRRRR